jgi:hypothetical protein
LGQNLASAAVRVKNKKNGNKINKIDLLENSVIMSIYPYWYWRRNK